MSFLHPALAWGALAFTVPLLIHLLNRRRLRRIDWAAMEFLRRAYRKTRRRLALENLLLLLLRCAAVALLALGLARPVLEGGLLPGAALERAREAVLVIDGSFSMAAALPGGRPWEAGLRRAEEVLEGLDAGAGDRAHLVVAGSPPRLLSTPDPERARAELAGLRDRRPPAPTTDFSATLALVERLLDEGPASAADREVHWITDRQAAAFSDSGTESGSADQVKERLAASGALRILVHDLGGTDPRPPNRAVIDLAADTPGLPVAAHGRFTATVANFGDSEASGVRVHFLVDGERRPGASVDIPARGTAAVTLTAAFARPGEHAVEAVLEADLLPDDDRRALSVTVLPPTRVLLVDGLPSADPLLRGSGPLPDILAPSDDPLLADESPFRLTEWSAPDLVRNTGTLGGFDVVVMTAVGLLPEAVRSDLATFIEAGGGLWVFGGPPLEGADPGVGLGDLVPGTVGPRVQASDRRGDYFRIREFRRDHPAFALFDDPVWEPLLTEVPVAAFLPIEPAQGVQVLARMDDPARSALIVETRRGSGRIWWCGTTASAEWSSLASSPPTLVPLVMDTLRFLATPPPALRDLVLGSPLTLSLDALVPRVTVVGPDAATSSWGGTPVASPDGGWIWPPFEDADAPGVWRVKPEGAPERVFALGLDPAESDLERLDAGALVAAFAPLPTEIAGAIDHSSPAESDDDGRGGELARSVLIAAFALLMAESLLARWIGRRR